MPVHDKRLGRSAARRASAVLTALLLTISLVSPAFAVVFTNPAPITINDAVAVGVSNVYPSTINVAGLTGTITNVTVTINNLNHTFPDDYDILLEGPTGANILLMSDAGGSIDALNATLTFDDAAAGMIPDAGPVSTGTFKPSSYTTGDTFPSPAPAPSANTTLSATYAGTNPNGAWRLYAVDDAGADMGSIGNGWSVTITTSGSPATTFANGSSIVSGDGSRGIANPYPSTINVTGLTGAITDVNVTLTGVSHLNPDDLDIFLIGPSGKRMILLSDAGGTADAIGVNVTFDDASPNFLPDSGPMVTGTYKPTNVGGGDTLPFILPPYPNPITLQTATLASVFNGTEANGAWTLWVVDDATGNDGAIATGWSIDITTGGTYGAKRFTSADFNGDGLTDVSVYRPSDNIWYTRRSSDYANTYQKWGSSGDIPVPGDYDGDRITDHAVYRPSTGYWIILNSSTGAATFTKFGISTDTPVPADYDGDGKIDVAVWRDGTWYVLQSGSGTVRILKWGTTGDIPVRGHFEGTNGADFTVFRPSTNTWYILNNAGTSFRAEVWGTTGDVLVPADYDGDRKTDIAVFRPSTGDWLILQSSTGSAFVYRFGTAGDIAVPGDYDGDTRADIAVYRPSAAGWYILNSGAPIAAASIRTDFWGSPGDVPVAATYLPPQ